MDRLFLDANVILSAAYRPGSNLLRLWRLTNAQLLGSTYVLDEAFRNIALSSPSSLKGLASLARVIEIVAEPPTEMTVPGEDRLPEKDRPVLRAAFHAKATHLLTGDKTHFGILMGSALGGVLILTPSQYLQRQGSE